MDSKDLKVLNGIIDNLKSTTSRNEKIAILESSKENELWTEVLQFLLDPMVVTGIAKSKLEKYSLEHKLPRELAMMDLSFMMAYLRKHNTGTKADVFRVLEFVSQHHDHKEWLLQLFTKTLKLGVDAKTVNKVYGNDFINVFSVMLAESFDKNENFVKGKEFTVTQKLDGVRCVAFVHENGEIQFFTRNGQDYGKLPQVEDELRCGHCGMVFDGELIAKYDSSDTGEVFRKTVSTANKNGVKEGLVYHIFDVIPMDEFLSGKSIDTYIYRRRKLESLLEGRNLEYVKVLPTLYIGSSYSMIDKLASEAIENGWEGLMVNLNHMPYEARRTKSLLKVKKFKTVDVFVTGVFEGEGALKGTLGGIEVEFIVDGKVHTSKCGSGFKLDERNLYWKHQDMLIGNVVELKCFEVSKDVDGNYSLRFPVWLNVIRLDKGREDISIF